MDLTPFWTSLWYEKFRMTCYLKAPFKILASRTPAISS